MSHKETKADKKKAMLLKNRKLQILMQHMRGHAEEAERMREEAERPAKEALEKAKKKEGEEEVVWSAKMQMMRNRLTGQREMAKERWNRFSGTSDGGGRGL